MPPSPSKPIGVRRAVSCALVNLLATPGLGSLMGRRFIVGSCQLALAVAGFLAITLWIGALFCQQIAEAMEKSPALQARNWMWQVGLALFGAAWLWSLVTSIDLYLKAKANEAAATPPRITNPPDKI
ncbi:MAG: hypothetical protein U1F65_01290 [Verrucomicrobiota bacterium]